VPAGPIRQPRPDAADRRHREDPLAIPVLDLHEFRLPDRTVRRALGLEEGKDADGPAGIHRS
jgi:hypothetical protein